MKMTKIIVLSTIITLIASCSNLNYDTITSGYFYQKASNHQLYYGIDFGYDLIINEQSIATYISQTIVYRKDQEDIWKNPEDTYNDRFGDCDDTALIFLNISYLELNKKYNLVVVNMETMTYESNDDYVPSNAPMLLTPTDDYHIMIQDPISGRIYEPRTFKQYRGPVHETYEFDYIFGV